LLAVTRVIVTLAVAVAVLVVGYHQFTAASGQSLPQPGTTALPGLASTPQTSTEEPPKGLSADRFARLVKDQTAWQAAFESSDRATITCGVQLEGRSGCAAAAYRAWAVPFARLQRDTTAEMRTVDGTCRSTLAESAGLKGPGTKLRTYMRRVEKDIAGSQGPGVPDGLIADSRGALTAQGAILLTVGQISAACGN
jgi:hypothetical protein